MNFRYFSIAERIVYVPCIKLLSYMNKRKLNYLKDRNVAKVKHFKSLQIAQKEQNISKITSSLVEYAYINIW